jgi:hypothetical protein
VTLKALLWSLPKIITMVWPIGFWSPKYLIAIGSLRMMLLMSFKDEAVPDFRGNVNMSRNSGSVKRTR